jgi:ankyrin repeat protein
MSVDDMLTAAKRGDVETVRRLMTSDPSLAGALGGSGETPVMAALYRGHRSVVDALVDGGAPIDIFVAAALGRMAELENALNAGAPAVNAVAYDGWTPLHLAAFFGHRDAAARLLEAGAALQAVSRNSLRNTALHAAVAGGHEALAVLLMERGADVTAQDAGGHTPLHIAAEAGSVGLARALLERGADPHAVDAEEQTPLSRAAARNHGAIIDLINDPR